MAFTVTSPAGSKVSVGTADLARKLVTKGYTTDDDLPDAPEPAPEADGDVVTTTTNLTEDGDPEPVGEMPPMNGKGSGRDAWHAYAKANGFDDAVLEGMSRDDIAALFDVES